MSPLNITQPLGIWSIMATIRWCPIFPKWDSYQPLKSDCHLWQVILVLVLGQSYNENWFWLAGLSTFHRVPRWGPVIPVNDFQKYQNGMKIISHSWRSNNPWLFILHFWDGSCPINTILNCIYIYIHNHIYIYIYIRKIIYTYTYIYIYSTCLASRISIFHHV